MAEAGGAAYAPRNALRRNIPDGFWGLGFSGFAQARKNQPLFVGLSMAFSGIDRFQSPVNIQYSTGLVDVWNSETRSSVFHLNGLARYYVEIGSPSLIPFLELSTGGNFFYTSTRLTYPDSEESSSSFDNSDFIFCYGGGLGLSLSFSDRLYLTAKWIFQFGLSGSYYVQTRSSIDVNYGETIDAFDFRQSATDLSCTFIGLTYSF